MKRQILLIILTILVMNLYSQESDIANKSFTGKNSLQIELLGNGFLYSLNYERVLLNGGKFKTTGQVGYSMMGMGGQMFPLALTELISFNRNHVEIGIGYSFADYLTSRLTGRIGYRYQKPDGHLVFRIAFMPWYERVRDYNGSNIQAGLNPWTGVTVGYSF
ncbi:MAG: hypothetical protein GXO83_06830 [Chlorobi bacterium]|nr:hypothetical protein [Chlorobiota bacterium]